MSAPDRLDTAAAARELLTVVVGGQLCGIDLRAIQEILPPRRITPVPLAPPAVRGLLNLRGRIVTAIDLRRRLGLGERAPGAADMSVVVERAGALYGLAVESVGEVLRLPPQGFAPVPATLDPPWRRFCAGVFRLDDTLLVVLDDESVLDFVGAQGHGEDDDDVLSGR